MSRANKRKHVMRETFLDDYSLPTEKQQIVKVLLSKGNNLLEVTTPDSSTFLVSLPTKFRRNIWVKRGDYLVVEPIEEGRKVKGEMVRIITVDHRKIFKKENVWPKQFDDPTEDKKRDDDLYINNNRLAISDESEDEDDDGDDDSSSEDSSSDSD